MAEILGSKLSDRIIAEGAKIANFGGPRFDTFRSQEIHFQDTLRRSPIFYIQGVYEYFRGYSEDRTLRLTDLPCVAPPYPSFFTEFRIERQHQALMGYKRAGVLYEAFELPEYDKLAHPKLPMDNLSGAKWILRGTSVIETTSINEVVMVTREEMPVREDGTMLPEGDIGKILLGYREGNPGISAENMPEVINDITASIVFPTLLAITFTHVKGARVREEEPLVGLSRRHEKKTGHPLVKYHTIDINPMREILLQEGRVETEGLKRALHLVRGHFADYRERGLFGRTRGIFWFSDHIKGTEEAGIVVKDYTVQTP